MEQDAADDDAEAENLEEAEGGAIDHGGADRGGHSGEGECVTNVL